MWNRKAVLSVFGVKVEKLFGKSPAQAWLTEGLAEETLGNSSGRHTKQNRTRRRPTNSGRAFKAHKIRAFEADPQDDVVR